MSDKQWDDLVDPARAALEALITSGDNMTDRIEKLEKMIASVIDDTGDTPEIMAASRAEWAARALAAEAKLAKAVEALEKLDVGEGWAAQIARTTLAELKGGKDAKN